MKTLITLTLSLVTIVASFANTANAAPPDTAAERKAYTDERWRTAVEAIDVALANPKMDDLVVLRYLLSIRELVDPNVSLIRATDPLKDRNCSLMVYGNKTEAYVDPKVSPLRISFCAPAYSDVSIRLLIHEMTHLVQSGSSRGLLDECDADLVSGIVLFALPVEERKRNAAPGGYDAQCPDSYRDRFWNWVAKQQ